MPQHRVPLAAALLATLVAIATARGQASDTLRLPLRWEVAEGLHPTADSLGKLSGVALDSAGNVYVSDFSDARIWVFGPDGRSLRAIGRKGKGPGEFEAPTGIAIGPDGKLYVRDLEHVSLFSVDPETKRLARYETRFRGPLMSDWTSQRTTRFDRAGHLFYPQFAVMTKDGPSGWYYQYTTAGELRDSLRVSSFPTASVHTAYVRLDARGGRMLSGLNRVPFAPWPTWDVTPRGTLLIGDGTSYLLTETDASGRVLREFRRSVAPERIPAAERRDSLAALSARLDSITVPWSQVVGVPPEVRAKQLPEHYPAYIAAYAAEDGRVWVRRWVSRGDRRTVFDVFEADGRFVRVVELSRNLAVQPAPVLGLREIVGISIDAETGAHTVVRFGSR
ncbi:MAG: hypothetical protein KF709_11895 [Gemmatimonadaceae bacterium]|nr:hypothetical protein [Gemmatimonadaceae bacterium]